MDKARLLAELAQRLRAHLDALDHTRDSARHGMRVDGDHRPENRGERAAVTSQGYLAHGLEQRRAELVAALDLVERIPPDPRPRVSTGALVQVEGDEPGWYLVVPGGQAEVLTSGAAPVTVVSPTSPRGAALLGAEVGDEVTLRLGARVVELEVVAVG